MCTLSSHMNGELHHSCERGDYAFMVLRKYLIIFHILLIMSTTKWEIIVTKIKKDKL